MSKEKMMKKPTMEEVLKLVRFERDEDGKLVVASVKGCIEGDVMGSIYGKVWGDVGKDVAGYIRGRKWQLIETTSDKAIRLIREGKSEEAAAVLEEAAHQPDPRKLPRLFV